MAEVGEAAEEAVEMALTILPLHTQAQEGKDSEVHHKLGRKDSGLGFGVERLEVQQQATWLVTEAEGLDSSIQTNMGRGSGEVEDGSEVVGMMMERAAVDGAAEDRVRGIVVVVLDMRVQALDPRHEDRR